MWVAPIHGEAEVAGRIVLPDPSPPSESDMAQIYWRARNPPLVKGDRDIEDENAKGDSTYYQVVSLLSLPHASVSTASPSSALIVPNLV